MTEHDIFISYSKKDSELVTKLAEDLRERNFKVWFDTEIGGGEHWRNTIEDKLKASEEVIVVLSPPGKISASTFSSPARVLTNTQLNPRDSIFSWCAW